MEVQVQCRTERRAKRCRGVQPVGELASDGEARYSSGAVRIGDGSGTKFCVLTRGDLSASVVGAVLTVVVEEPKTRQRWDERSRRVA